MAVVTQAKWRQKAVVLMVVQYPFGKQVQAF